MIAATNVLLKILVVVVYVVDFPEEVMQVVEE
jgi:hypothetical protein